MAPLGEKMLIVAPLKQTMVEMMTMVWMMTMMAPLGENVLIVAPLGEKMLIVAPLKQTMVEMMTMDKMMTAMMMAVDVMILTGCASDPVRRCSRGAHLRMLVLHRSTTTRNCNFGRATR